MNKDNKSAVAKLSLIFALIPSVSSTSNSYTEKSGNDGISFVFYDDNNIGSIQGYKYEMNTAKDLYFYDKIESGYNYITNLKGRYYGDFSPEQGLTKQKNIKHGNSV